MKLFNTVPQTLLRYTVDRAAGLTMSDGSELIEVVTIVLATVDGEMAVVMSKEDAMIIGSALQSAARDAQEAQKRRKV